MIEASGRRWLRRWFEFSVGRFLMSIEPDTWGRVISRHRSPSAFLVSSGRDIDWGVIRLSGQWSKMA